jgi:hypothetical protein
MGEKFRGGGSCGRWAFGIRWEEMDKYFRRDVGGKGKDGVFVGVETCLQVLPLKLGCAEGLFECQNARIQL